MLFMNRTVVQLLQATVWSKLKSEPGLPGFGVDFERCLMAVVMACSREVVRQELLKLDPAEREICIDGEKWTRAVRSEREYDTQFGKVSVERGLYRKVRNGPTRCPMEERFGLLESGWTSDAARLSCFLLTDLTSRGVERFFREQGGMNPSRTKLERLTKGVGDVLESNRERIDGDLRTRVEIPTAAVTVAVSLDGVMVKLQESNRKEQVAEAKMEGRKVGGPIGSSEASVGTLTFYDAQCGRLQTRRFGRMPEPNKQTMKDLLQAELVAIRAARPDLRVVAVSDGASNLWSFLESLNPDHQVVDAYHTLEHLKRRLDRSLGVGSHATQTTYAAMKESLLTTPGGHESVFAQLERIERRAGKFKPRKRKGKGAQPTFYERHHDRMKYAEHRQLRLPIGSGVVEGTARYMVVDRLRRTGMRWKSQGGQAILTMRQYAANNQFNDAWGIYQSLEREAKIAVAA